MEWGEHTSDQRACATIQVARFSIGEVPLMDEGVRELELFKAQLQVDLKKFEATLASQQAAWEENAIRDRERWLGELRIIQTMHQAIVDFALVTIRSLILANGGAIVGLVTFTGNIWSKGGASGATVARAITPGIGYFVAGLVFALLTAGLAYVSQVVYSEMKRPQPAQKVGNTVRGFAVLLAFLSLIAFIIGAYASLAAFHSPPPS
jgi:hypothetical protein